MRRLIALVVLAIATPAGAVVAVDPNGVNINRNGVTTVFLTFQGTANQESVNAFWCGEITVLANTPTPTNPCVPGTIFGRLPARNDLSRASGTAGQANTTDIMTIPASVARRALQDARAGAASQFFYVREFRDRATGATEFIAVTCRMAGGGARVPFAITRAVLRFEDGDDPALALVRRGQTLPPVVADLAYNGTGRLQGRWELVLPGEPEPSAFDLLPAAALPIEQRNLQKIYTTVERFEVFLPPVGQGVLPGPDPALLPTEAPGSYTLLLRIEATGDKEGNSATGVGTVTSGGVAGFAMPVFRYAVIGGEGNRDVTLGVPVDGGSLNAESPLFTWLAAGGAMHRMELVADDGPVFAALVPPGENRYAPPPFIAERARSGALRWRVVVLDERGAALTESPWSALAPPAAASTSPQPANGENP